MTIISANVIADTMNPHGNRLTTLQLRYPRFIHSEFMTHRMFSRNASSSRAIPVEKMISDILYDTAMPVYWGANQKGMQAGEEIDTEVFVTAYHEAQTVYEDFPLYELWEDVLNKETAWMRARDQAIEMALSFHKAGYHKQIVNRLLEPFMHINVVVSATEWANFFHLRDHPDAEPHIRDLAIAMKEALARSTPGHLDAGQWHLPYIQNFEWVGGANIEDLKKVSAARCARVSYLTHDGRQTTLEEDVALCERLAKADILHASPFEHQAFADTYVDGAWLNKNLHGNLVGFGQNRKMYEGENYEGSF